MAKKSTDAVEKAMNVEDWKPRLTFMANDLPEVKNHEVGKEYTVKVKMKMVSKSEGGWDGTRGLEGTYKILSAKGDGYDEED